MPRNFKGPKKIVVAGPTVDSIYGRPSSPARAALSGDRSIRSAPAYRNGAMSSNTSITSINNRTVDSRDQTPEKQRGQVINTEDMVEDYEYILNGIRYYAADNTSVGSASVNNHNKHARHGKKDGGSGSGKRDSG